MFSPISFDSLAIHITVHVHVFVSVMMHVASGVTLILLVGVCVVVDSLPVKPASLTIRSQRDELLYGHHVNNMNDATTETNSVSLNTGENYCDEFTTHTPGFHRSQLYVYESNSKVKVCQL